MVIFMRPLSHCRICLAHISSSMRSAKTIDEIKDSIACCHRLDLLNPRFSTSSRSSSPSHRPLFLKGSRSFRKDARPTSTP